MTNDPGAVLIFGRASPKSPPHSVSGASSWPTKCQQRAREGQGGEDAAAGCGGGRQRACPGNVEGRIRRDGGNWGPSGDVEGMASSFYFQLMSDEADGDRGGAARSFSFLTLFFIVESRSRAEREEPRR